MKCKKWPVLVAEDNSLVEAGMLVAKVLEEHGYSIVLVVRALKVVGEATTAEGRRDLRVTCRSTHARDPGTCENMVVQREG
jgi:hypothetical protein